MVTKKSAEKEPVLKNKTFYITTIEGGKHKVLEMNLTSRNAAEKCVEKLAKEYECDRHHFIIREHVVEE